MDGRAWRELGARKFRGEVVEMRTRDLPVLGVARAASSLSVSPSRSFRLSLSLSLSLSLVDDNRTSRVEEPTVLIVLRPGPKDISREVQCGPQSPRGSVPFGDSRVRSTKRTVRHSSRL